MPKWSFGRPNKALEDLNKAPDDLKKLWKIYAYLKESMFLTNSLPLL